MKKNSFFFIKFTIFLLLMTNSFHAAAKTVGFNACQQLKVLFQKNDIPVIELPVISAGTELFPFNLRVDTNHAKQNDYDFYFVFSVEDALKNHVFVTDLLDYFLTSYFYDANIHFIFTCNDNTDFYENTTLSGTETFIANLDKTDNLAAVCVSFNELVNSVISGSGGKCSPSWIQNLTTASLFENKLFYIIRGGFISPFYRFKVLKEDFKTGAFLKNNIPAIGLDLYTPKFENDYEKRIISFFASMIFNFDKDQTDQWEIHNQTFTVGNFAVNIPERFTLIALIIFTVASLFLICEFSFFFRKTKKNYSRNIMNCWFIIPVVAVLTTIAFATGQWIASIIGSATNTDFYTLFAIKAFIGFGLITLVYFFLLKANKVQKTQVYSYLLVLSSLFNIFLFSAIDISLFYLFAIEYVIIYISRISKRTVFISITFLLMCVPYIPYLFQLILYIEPSVAKKIVFCPAKYNIAVSTAFLPFEFTWLRIIVQLNDLWKKVDTKKKKFIKQNVIAISSSVGIFAVIVLAVAKFIPEEYKQKEDDVKVRTFQSRSGDLLNIGYEDAEYFNSRRRIIHITMKDQAQNVQLKVSCENSEPVSYSEYSYISDSENKAVYFNLPEWPPKKFNISYIPGSDEKTTVTLKAIYPDNDFPFSKIEIVQEFEILAAGDEEK